jgi:hypothetical protein
MSDQITTDLKFAIVPVWLMERNPSNSALRVYIVLAKRADNSTGEAWPGRSTIAREANISLRSVDRGIAELEQLGALKKTRRFDDRGYSKSSLYVVYRVSQGGVTGDTSATHDATPCHMSTTELDPKNYTHKATEGEGADAPRTDSGDRDSEPGRNLSSERCAGKSKVKASERAITDSSYAARLFAELGENAPDLDPERAADNYLALLAAAKKAGRDVEPVAIGLALGLLVRTFGPLPGGARGLVVRLVRANGPTSVVQAAVTTCGSAVGLDERWADDPLGPVRYMAGVVRGKR